MARSFRVRSGASLGYIIGHVRITTTFCRLIKEFEREARVDGRPTEEIVAAKQRYVNQVNSYVARKKQAAAELKAQATQSTPPQQQPATASAYATPPLSSDQQPTSQKQVQGMLQCY